MFISWTEQHSQKKKQSFSTSIKALLLWNCPTSVKGASQVVEDFIFHPNAGKLGALDWIILRQIFKGSTLKRKKYLSTRRAYFHILTDISQLMRKGLGNHYCYFSRLICEGSLCGAFIYALFSKKPWNILILKTIKNAFNIWKYFYTVSMLKFSKISIS